VHTKFKDWPLKQLLITPYSWENPGTAQPAGHICPGDKRPLTVSLFFLSLNKKTENQSEWNCMTSRILSPWKASLPPSMLRKVAPIFPYWPVPKLLEKTCRANGWATHTTHDSPTHPPGNINQCSPWAEWPPPNKTEKHKQQIVI
jgi:hypothetical protein